MQFLRTLLKKPTRNALEAYSRQCMSIAACFQLVWEKGEIPPRKGQLAINLTSQVARDAFLEAMLDVIADAELYSADRRKLKILSLIDRYKGQQLKDDAAMILSHINYLDHACMMQSAFYQRSKELELILSTTLKHCALAWSRIAGDNIPDWLSNIWPHFALALRRTKNEMYQS